ncbi:MAG: hypothetical protein PHV34_05955 [Verrucomicrobiae bacterium]|nr:hypothetical protein [Verrucomicrobiae bacterium]
MKKYPILFSGEMVRAILDGYKMQTRRVVMPQPNHFLGVSINRKTPFDDDGKIIKCPYGQPGDRLWMRERWCTGKPFDNISPGRLWKGNDSEQLAVNYATEPEWVEQGKWRPSIHMPRWASRITLEIIKVRVERVQEITEDDAKAEGAKKGLWLENDMLLEPTDEYEEGKSSYKQGFGFLWDSINAKRGFGWESNPWVWAIEFRRVTA